MNISIRDSIKDSFLNGITLGKSIKMKRESLGMSINELADKISVSSATLSRIESGKIKKPRAVYLFRLSKVLEISYELLLELQGYDMEYIGYRDRRDTYR